jgi:hypothetical protein
MNAYIIALFAHSYLRWLVLALALSLLVRTGLGWGQNKPWTGLDERLHVAFVASVDTQLLLGLLLYALLSPVVRLFFSDTAHAMKDPALRFFGIEHAFGMLLATVVVHVARAASKKATTSQQRHRVTFKVNFLALLLMAGSIPWPHAKYGRPLLRTVQLDAPSSALASTTSDKPGAASRPRTAVTAAPTY